MKYVKANMDDMNGIFARLSMHRIQMIVQMVKVIIANMRAKKYIILMIGLILYHLSLIMDLMNMMVIRARHNDDGMMSIKKLSSLKQAVVVDIIVGGFQLFVTYKNH